MRKREEVFDHFITAVINTLNADEIYDAAIEALQDILQPNGLLLMMNQNTRHVFSVIRKCGSIACTKSYSVPTDSMLQELKDSPNLIMLNDTGKHILRPYDSKTAQLAECRTHHRHLYAQIQSGHYRLSLSCSP